MRIWRFDRVSSVLLVALACSTSAQQARQMAPSEVVARIGSTPVTLGEVDARALQEPVDSFGMRDWFRRCIWRGAPRSMDRRRPAARQRSEEPRHRSRRARDAEIAAKVTAPTDADVEFWYQTNPDRVQGRPLDQLRAPIRSLLVNERTIDAREALLTVLKAKTPVSVLLEPPRAGGRHRRTRRARDRARRPIELVEFSDFQCPFCQRANPTVEQVLKTYGDKIRFVYRHYRCRITPTRALPPKPPPAPTSRASSGTYHDRLFANAGS